MTETVETPPLKVGDTCYRVGRYSEPEITRHTVLAISSSGRIAVALTYRTKKPTYDTYPTFRTWGEARAHIISRKQEIVDATRASLTRAETLLANALALPEVEP